MNIVLAILIFSSEGVASSLICPTARVLGLGGTGFSLVHGPEAVFFNPASLRIENDELGFAFSYGRVFLDLEQSALFLMKKIAVINAGLGLVNFDYGELDFKPEYPTEVDSATFNANDLSVIMAFGLKLSPKGMAGISIKYLRETIYIYSSSALAFNFALNYQPNQSNKISLGVSDLSRLLKLKEEGYGLPVRFTIGFAHQTNRLLTGLDLHYLIRSSDWMLNVGEEITIAPSLKLRCGFRYFDGLTLNAGLGLKLPWLSFEYGFGYLPKNLGFSHYFGLAKNF